MKRVIVRQNPKFEKNLDPFDMMVFKSFKTQKQRFEYCMKRLKILGSGISRTVFKIDNNKALKLALDMQGVLQNHNEVVFYTKNLSCFAKIYERSSGYQWLIVECARKVKNNDFQDILGYDFNIIKEWISYYEEYKGEKKINDNNKEIFEKIIFQNFFNDLRQALKKGLQDINKLDSWGVVKRNGKEQMCIVDYGLLGFPNKQNIS